MKNKMPVKEFLDRGYTFVDGDVFAMRPMIVGEGINECSAIMANDPDGVDKNLFVVSAKALTPKRMKVSCEKIEFNLTYEAVKAFELGEVVDGLYFVTKGEFKKVASSLEALKHFDKLYRKVETEITPMQAAKEACLAYIGSSSQLDVDNQIYFFTENEDAGAVYDDEFVEMCRAIAKAYYGN